MANIDGVNNVAVGTLPLSSNTSGSNNTAVGDLALQNSVNTSNHVCVGRLAGSGITDVNDNIIIGHHTGVHSRFGQEGEVCYIDNIYGANVDDTDGISRIVLVDPDGRLGTMPIAAGGIPHKSSTVQPKAIPHAAEQAMFNLKVQNLRATVVQQQQQIERLTAQLQDNTAQIQKAKAQLEVNEPEAKVVVNKPKAVR